MALKQRQRFHGPAALSRVVLTYADKPNFLKVGETTSVHEATISRDHLTKYKAYMWEIYSLDNNFAISRKDWKRCFGLIWT